MMFDPISADATVPLPRWEPPPKRERRGCRIDRRLIDDHWRPAPYDADLSERDLLYVIVRGELPPEPPPPDGWADWPRTRGEAAGRLAGDWYGIEPTSYQEDPACGDYIVTGWAIHNS